MQLEDIYSVHIIPAKLDNYSLYTDTMSVAFAKTDFVYSFVHFGDNLFPGNVINDIKTYLNQNVNGISVYYVCFYSPMLPGCEFKELEKKYSNFVYYHQPLIAFGQIPGHVDVDLEPPVHIQTEYTKNYCCLINRSTDTRRQLFNFLQEKNLLELGHVSYRNVERENHAPRSDDTTHLLVKPYKNFKDVQYTDDQTDNPRKYVWYFPLLDFLFDFSIETFDEDVPFLTEKSTKAFFWGKIPVSTSSRNLMHYIEQFGFDIFRDVIDYKYDIQRDKDLRMELYLQEIHKLATMDISTIPDLKIRLENNRRLMCTLVKRSQTTLENINLNTRYIAENRDKFLGY